MKPRTWIITGIVVAIILFIVFYKSSESDIAEVIETEVQEGVFEIRVTVTGELKARNSVEIAAPHEGLKSIRVWEVSIASLVPEGTVVDSGDVVATLDQTQVMNSLKDVEEEIEKEEGNIEKAQIDSSLQLRQQRDQILNLKFSMEEAEIALEQSVYESPAVKRQAQINLDKAKREYEQALNNFSLKEQQLKVTIRQQMMELNKKIRQRETINKTLEQLVIKAPSHGMVTYRKERDGSKRKVGDQIQMWRDPVVATLPDLSSLQSLTYVNEIDISKVKTGQPVEIGVDAFPEMKFTGTVIQVANIGEQLPNTDAKVFEVIIDLYGTDPLLRPSMTTSNSIVTQRFDSVKYLPLEAVHSNDSITFVYTKSGRSKLVVLGESNENSIIIEQGLETGEKVLLSIPENPEEYKYSNLELVSVIYERKKQKEEEIKQQRNSGNKRPKFENRGTGAGQWNKQANRNEREDHQKNNQQQVSAEEKQEKAKSQEDNKKATNRKQSNTKNELKADSVKVQ